MQTPQRQHLVPICWVTMKRHGLLKNLQLRKTPTERNKLQTYDCLQNVSPYITCYPSPPRARRTLPTPAHPHPKQHLQLQFHPLRVINRLCKPLHHPCLQHRSCFKLRAHKLGHRLHRLRPLLHCLTPKRVNSTRHPTLRRNRHKHKPLYPKPGPRTLAHPLRFRDIECKCSPSIRIHPLALARQILCQHHRRPRRRMGPRDERDPWRVRAKSYS
jgi:hypothetical protein